MLRAQNGETMYRSARFAFRAFERARQLVIKLHLAGPLRKYFGPLMGKLIYRLSVQGSGVLIVHGHKMLLASHGYPPLQMVNGAWERDTVRLFERILRAGDVVVDIGAHVGYFTLIAARSVGPEGRVYAFEPDPENYALLVRNIELNGYQNIMPIQKAVWNLTDLFRSEVLRLRTE
jgi:tRNA G37 N-methylase Trm5